jgi:hypothetical protein
MSDSFSETMTPSATPRINYDVIVKYFRYPLEDAAKKLNVDKNELIECCRVQGIKRWPYRRGMKSVNIEVTPDHQDDEKTQSFHQFKSLIHKKLIKGENKSSPGTTPDSPSVVVIPQPIRVESAVVSVSAPFLGPKSVPVRIVKQTKTMTHRSEKMSINHIMN